MRLNFRPGDYEGVWDLEDAYEMLDPNDPEDAAALIEIPRHLVRQRARLWRVRMQDPAARLEEEAWHRRRRARQQRERRLRRTERELYIELASEHERREEGAEEAYFHFVDSVVRSSNSFVSPLDDRAYTNLVNSDEMGEAWEQLSRDERDVHYGAVGAILGPPLPPAWTHVPCDFVSEEHQEVFTVLRARRRRPTRGQGRFDIHLPRSYTFGGADAWRHIHSLYGKWTTTLGLRREENDELNALLGDVLRPAGDVGYAHGAVVFDVRAPPATRRAMLLDIGWPQGATPTVGELVAHILDRLEYACAHDIACGLGAAGAALSGTRGWSEDEGELGDDMSDPDSEAEERRCDDWATALRGAGLDTATLPPGVRAMALALC